MVALPVRVGFLASPICVQVLSSNLEVPLSLRFIISAAVVFIFAAVVFFLGAWMMWLVPATRRIEHLEFLVGHFQKLLRESDRAHDAAQSVLLAERMAERARYSHYSRPLLEFVSQGLLMEAGEDDRLLSCNVFPISELEKGAGLTKLCVQSLRRPCRLEQFALDRAVDAGKLRLELLNFLRDGLARGFPSPMRLVLRPHCGAAHTCGVFNDSEQTSEFQVLHNHF